MKIGISTARLTKLFSDIDLLKMIADAKFQCVDFYWAHSDINRERFTSKEKIREYYTAIRKNAEDLELEIFQTHAPYPTQKFDNMSDDEILVNLKNSIYATASLGAKYTVIHPKMPYFLHYGGLLKPIRKALNMNFYRELLRVAEDQGVIITLENMFCCRRRDNVLVKTTLSSPEEILDYKRSLASPNVGICLDIGHSHLIYHDNGLAAIAKLAGQIDVVHIHDNDGISDMHLVPGEANIDWHKVLPALINSGFRGSFNLECGGATPKGGVSCVASNIKRAYENFTALISDVLS
ncbi:MAG: sugar phosphate isomerase/epimerase [Christensenellaceae bacterium]|nr:sugar phosphate isomerase/epimerase [Christensenellaceae bacterium]